MPVALSVVWIQSGCVSVALPLLGGQGCCFSSLSGLPCEDEDLRTGHDLG